MVHRFVVEHGVESGIIQESIDYFTKSKPLSDDIMWEIDRVHMKNRLPIFSSNLVGKDWDGEGEIGETIP